MSPPQRILIIRLSAIGDVVNATCLLPALRKRWPECRIDWLVESGNGELLTANPDLDRVIRWPRREWQTWFKARQYRRLWQAFRALRAELRQEHYDWVLDIQGLLKSGLWAWLAQSDRRIGLGSKEGSQWWMHETLDRHSDDNRLGSEYLKLAQHLTGEVPPFRLQLVLSGQHRQRARDLLQNHAVQTPYAVIAPFTTRPQKHWFLDHWAELSSQLMEQLGLSVVLLGGPGDHRQVAELQRLSQKPIRNLCGQASLAESAAVVERAALVIGVDTGLTHMGMAFERPTLALFGSTRPYLRTPGHLGRVLYEPLECSPCRWHPTCDGAFTCMRQHTPETVLAQARTLLEQAG